MTLEIKQIEGGFLGILDGRFDTASSADVARAMQPLLDNADKHIILDCSKLSFISSSGLRLLLSLRKQTIAKGGDVSIKGLNDDVKQIFTITGFYSLFKFE